MGHEKREIFVNHPTFEFSKRMETDDRPIFVIINKLNFKDSNLATNWLTFDQIVLDTLKRIGIGYISTYYFDCDWLEKQEVIYPIIP